jgi:cell wall-associated NlpC family hydrolase
MSFDRRTTLARPDLADMRLEGQVRAERFADVRAAVCAATVAPIRAAADDASEQQDQLLFGEGFDVLDETGGWSWGQACRDGYVGFVRSDLLAPRGEAPTHRIRAPRTWAYARADMKSAALTMLSMNALVRPGEAENGFLHIEGAGWVYGGHLARVGEFEADPVAVALGFQGSPYLWGGRDSQGVDCSGLVQQAFYACGRFCPRDTDQQLELFSEPAPLSELSRGDLIFWRGHVGVMIDHERLLHANAFHMAVAVEPLAAAVARIKSSGSGELVALRRP